MFALWGFVVRILQDFPKFAAYKMQKNYQNVTLFISYQPYMHVRTSQMRANYILKAWFSDKHRTHLPKPLWQIMTFRGCSEDVGCSAWLWLMSELIISVRKPM